MARKYTFTQAWLAQCAAITDANEQAAKQSEQPSENATATNA
mgnify:CR=1 FL=1